MVYQTDPSIFAKRTLLYDSKKNMAYAVDRSWQFEGLPGNVILLLGNSPGPFEAVEASAGWSTATGGHATWNTMELLGGIMCI